MGERLDVLFPGGKRVDIRIRDFEIATDQSVKAGGDAGAPEPFDLFLASMAACAGIFALNFCQSRGLSTAGLRVGMHWDGEGKNPSQSKARLQLQLPVDFPAKYRSGIVKAIDLCAVKKQIQNPPQFVTEILE